MILSSSADRYAAFVQTALGRWVTHHPSWVENVDSAEGEIGYLVCESESDEVLAAASYCDDGDILVVGVSDPSGIVVADNAEPPTVYSAALRLATGLEAVAAQRSRRAVLVKSSAVCARGVRGLVAPVSLAFDEAGFEQVRRSFYAVEPADPAGALAGVSSRVRTQISSARRVFIGRDADSERDLASVVRMYAEHSAQRGGHCPFTVESLVRLSAPELNLTSARVYSPVEDTSRLLGFSISVHEHASAEIFTWGSLDQAATKAHLTKFIVADTLQALAGRGYQVIEYGCRFDGPEYGGLTEFYRRMGGREIPGVWMYKEICP